MRSRTLPDPQRILHHRPAAGKGVKAGRGVKSRPPSWLNAAPRPAEETSQPARITASGRSHKLTERALNSPVRETHRTEASGALAPRSAISRRRGPPFPAEQTYCAISRPARTPAPESPLAPQRASSLGRQGRGKPTPHLALQTAPRGDVASASRYCKVALSCESLED